MDETPSIAKWSHTKHEPASRRGHHPKMNMSDGKKAHERTMTPTVISSPWTRARSDRPTRVALRRRAATEKRVFRLPPPLGRLAWLRRFDSRSQRKKAVNSSADQSPFAARKMASSRHASLS